MPFITNDMPLDVDQVMQWEKARSERIETYKTLYNEDTAQRLIDAATQYHWVNPQLTASLILNGADYLMPEVGAHAAEKMAEVGLSPADRVRNDRIMKALRSRLEGGAE
jgi:hypothetical protein